MLKKMFFSGVASVAYMIIAIVVAILQSALAVRFFPKTEAGVWFLLLNIIVICAFFDFGLGPTLSREIGFAYKKNDYAQQISNLFFTIRKIIYLISIFIVIALILFGYIYLDHLPISPYRINHILYAFIIFSIGVIIRFQANPQLAVIYGFRYAYIERFIVSIGAIIGVIIGITLIFLQFGLLGLTIGYLCRALSIYLLARWFVICKIKIVPQGTFHKSIAKKIIEPCMQWSIMNVGALLIFQTSNFIIAYYLGMQNVAQFAVLMQIFTAIFTVSMIVSFVLTPYMSKTYGEKNYLLLQKFLVISVRLSVAIAIIFAIYFCFYIGQVIQLWLGSKFIIHQKTFILLMLVLILEVQHVAFAAAAMAAGYIKFAVIAMLAGILNVILSLIFVYKFGIFGVALALFISQILTNNWYVVKKSLSYFRYPVLSYLKQIIFPLVVFFVYILIATFMVHKMVIFNNRYVALSFGIILIAILSIIGMYCILLSPAEKLFLKQKMLSRINI